MKFRMTPFTGRILRAAPSCSSRRQEALTSLIGTRMSLLTSAATNIRVPADVPAVSEIENRKSKIEIGFSLVELLVTMALLSLIVLALMAVFSSTQQAFRASVTQVDVLEGSRAAMDLITTDLRGLTPSDGTTNYVSNNFYYPGAVNFFATNNSVYYSPLIQSLPPGNGPQRTNLLQWFFVLGRENTKWTGAGYIVNSGATNTLYPLYRFYAETNINQNPVVLYFNFFNTVYNAQWTNLSHVLDGVVHLTVQAYDPSGYPMITTYQSRGVNQWVTNKNVWFSAPQWGAVGYCMFSNTVPAAVELQLGVLEDRVLQRAESLSFQSAAQINYLTGQSGHVHIFRQRVTIPNVDPSAYQ